jgi:DNA-directed RNA polymerase subunit beta
MTGILDTNKSLLAPKPPVKPLQQPVEEDRREFGDAGKARTGIYNAVLKSAQELQPLTNQRHTLKVRDVNYADEGVFDIQKQKEAILTGKTLGRKLVGVMDLYDNATGGLLETRKMTLGRVPFMTERGTFIHNGNEYTISNQMRLRPGIFTRVKDNGEIEAHANILPGKGASHRYFLDPAKGVFYVRFGQAKIPLMPLLKALGAKDKQLQEAWGNSLWEANAQKDDPSALNKILQRLVRKADVNAPVENKYEAIRNAIEQMEVDPEVSQSTLGMPLKNLNLDGILATTKKLLAVSRGEADVDDRDHLAFQNVYGPEDLFAERVAKDYGGIRRGSFYKASFRGNLQNLQPNFMTKQIEAALLSSGLGQNLEEINPADVFDKQLRISRLGEGGIPGVDAVPDEARSVQPSHYGFMDPVRTPESFRTGVDVFIANTVRKGANGKVYAPFKDMKGQLVWKTPQEVSNMAIAFPQELNRKTKRVGVMQGGKIKYVPREQVDLVMPNFENAFSPLGNMIPMKSAVKAQRMAMASRMTTQALPLDKPESPWVRSGIMGEPENSYEKKYGRYMGAVSADRPGMVVGVDNHKIRVKYDDGTTEDKQLYHNFPYNRKTYLHNTALVRPGDRFTAGQTLARSNYTDDEGVTALGKNLYAAYIPFKGMNFEDALVISESAAKQKLASQHMYQHGIDWTPDHKQGKGAFISLFANKYDRKTLGNMDDDGVIKEGTVVNYGDPLVLAAKKKDIAYGKVHRKREAPYSDSSETWKHHSPGVVTDVFKTPKGTTVLVKSLAEMQVGDKLSGRYGDKGVISAIIPDDQMPHDANGQPFDVLLNPLGIISRTNPSQMVEAALGKIAAKTGKAYNVSDFDSIDDLTEFAIKELQKHNIPDLEDITDPETGRKIKQVFTGNRFFMKLHHTSESKGQGRGTGGYTMDATPAKGGEAGSKRISLLDNNALLSHGATEVLRDAGAIRGQRNEEFWLPFMQGLPPPKPKVPFVYEKFVNELRGSGINVIRDGNNINIMALTDKDVNELAGDRFIKSGDTVQFEKGMKPVAGGLFDPALTGGNNGNRWAAIKLHEPMPNPVMEEPIRRLLNLTQKDFEAVIAGKKDLRGASGPKAIAQALNVLNVDKEIAVAREMIKTGRASHRDQAVRKLAYLKAAKSMGLHPKDWLLTKAPVIPPIFRPVAVMSNNKMPLVADANYLYKELLEANNNLAEMSKEVDDVGDERLAVYKAFKAVTGLGDPVHPKLQEKNVKGLLKHIFGSNPKVGTVQRRLISSTVDLVGRAVITPNPDLDMDHVGLPEERAWDIYKNFIVRRLKRRGMPMIEAVKAVGDRTDVAKQELLKEMEDRPVVINRAPVLHRFGIMAFYPKLVKGDTLQISPLIVKGFGADFDGDAMQYHVPVSDEAKQEAAERMLPSRNLLSPADFKSPVHMPSQEYTGGLYQATAVRSGKKAQVFRNIKDVLAAYRRGEIEITDAIELLE